MQRHNDLLLLLGRIAMAAVFLPSGLRKLADLGGFIASMEGQGVPFASVLAPLGALIEVVAGIAVLVGFEVRFGALLLALFTVAATLIAHRFWDFEGAARQAQQIQFMKNLGLIGGLFFVMAAGGGRYCIERLWQRAPAGVERRQLRDRRQKTWPVPDLSP